jgi:hypothetical protein
VDLRIKLTRRRVALAALTVVAISAGGIAYAAVPDGTGVIHGCRANVGGTLRVVDSERGEGCRPSETALDWNQRGQQGLEGPPGPAGTAKAWARIDGSGGITSSHGLGSATVTHPMTGVYCIHNLPFEPHVAVGGSANGIVSDPGAPGGFAPIGYDLNVTAATLDRVAAPDNILGICDTTGPATAQVRVYVANPNGLFNGGFSIFIDG